MKVLWLASMLPTTFNWLAGPWNVRSMLALQKWGRADLYAICPIGLTLPESFVRRFPPDLAGIGEWFRVRLGMAPNGQIGSIPVS